MVSVSAFIDGVGISLYWRCRYQPLLAVSVLAFIGGVGISLYWWCRYQPLLVVSVSAFIDGIGIGKSCFLLAESVNTNVHDKLI